MPAILLIMDGAGLAPSGPGNAISNETMPYLFRLMDRFGYAALEASGPAVGLGLGQVGNSEVGHLSIGAGRALPSTLQRILSSLEDGSWAGSQVWSTIEPHETLHIVGLVSDAGVHAHLATLKGAVRIASERGCARIIVHPILDGIDSRRGTAPALLNQLLAFVGAQDRCALGTIMGRRWFCDRSGKHDLSAYCAETLSSAASLPPFSWDALERHLTSQGEDTFPGHAFHRDCSVTSGALVLITSHRADRAEQIARLLAQSVRLYALIALGDAVPAERVFFDTVPLSDGLFYQLRDRGIRTTRVAEQSKFPHVTYFLNGFRREIGERAICIQSNPEHMLASRPDMAAQDIVAATIRAMDDDAVIAVNIANLDQVGHLGDVTLARTAAHHVDRCVEALHEAAEARGWTLVVTADHGNAEEMTDDRGNPSGSHTTNRVPLIVVPGDGSRPRWIERTGSLANVCGTFLATLGIEQPQTFSPSLIA